MASIMYGNCTWSVDGDVAGLMIRYKGAIEITDKTSDSHFISANDSKIVIFPLGKGELGDLFNYQGYLKITSVTAANTSGEKIQLAIIKVMDYPELLGTAESITINSENMTAGYSVGKSVKKTTLDKNIIENLDTNNHKGIFYLDGQEYSGYYHIHIKGGIPMTGATHTKDSKILTAKVNFIAKGNRVVRKPSKTTRGGRGGY